MKAIKLAEPRQVDCVELEKPVPGPGQALIRIKTAGICGSDIGAFRGTNKLVSYPRIIGHELAGIIEEIPADNPKGLKVGGQSDRGSVSLLRNMLSLQHWPHQLLHQPEGSGRTY